MPCEKYKLALTDTAGAGAASSRELAAHLNACPACRAFFAAEQQLFAAIDSGVQKISNSDVPPSLLATVRALTRGQRVEARYWFRVAAAVTAVALSIGVVRYSGSVRDKRNAPSGTSSAAVASAPIISSPAPIPAPGKIGRVPPRRAAVRPATAKPVHPSEVAVLISDGQKQAFDRLLAGLKNGAIEANMLVVEKSEEAPRDQVILPLAIAPIDITPLAPVGEESVPANASSNR